MIELITRLQREKNIAIGFICHDLGLVQSFSHEVAVMYLGNIKEKPKLVEISEEHKVACHRFNKASAATEGSEEACRGVYLRGCCGKARVV